MGGIHLKKRLLSLLLALVMVVGMIPAAISPASAADSVEEALGEINIYNSGVVLDYLCVNGIAKKQPYDYYLYTNSKGEQVEVPVYCVSPTQYGVTETVGAGESIKYTANEKSKDPKIMGIVANGYPTKSLAELGVNSKYEAWYATKTALWCYLLSSWDISALSVNPNCSDQAAAQRVLAAVKKAYGGIAWTSNMEPGMTCTPDKSVAYDVTIDGKAYKQQIYTASSLTWVCGTDIKVGFSNPDDAPAGTRIVDMDNKDITAISTEYVQGQGYVGQFKVLYPADAVKGKTGSVQLSLNAEVYQYAIFYAVCAEKNKYGNLQNYMATTDPTTPIRLNAISSYSSDPDAPDIPDTPNTPNTPDTPSSEPGSLRIVKLETGTETPLAGAVFEVVGPNGDTIGSFATDESGTILLPDAEPGNYTVYERSAPRFHLICKDAAQNVTVISGKEAEVTFYNDPYGSLRVEKYSDTGEGLEGVTIQIKHIESGATQSAQTGPGGVAVFDQLKPGAYEVRETAGIKGWIADTETIQTVSVVTGEMSTSTFTNKELPGLRIIKYDRTTMEVLPDVTFTVWCDGELLGDFKTNNLGEILLTDQKPGTYVAQEKQSDDAHITVTTAQQVELHAGDGIKPLVFFNDLKPGIHLIKVDSSDLSKPIANARFKFEAVDGSWGPEELTTGADGAIDLSKLPAGAAVVTELDCPGYVIDEAQRIIELKPNETAQFVFTNSKKPSLYLLKTSSDGTPMEGVSFRLAKIEDGTHYLDRKTSATGEILWEGLEPGVYSLVETATLNDHILSMKEHHIELFPRKTSEIVLENHKRPNLYVYKNDADDGSPIEHTIFTVRAADGHSVDEIETGPDGCAVLENLLPGVYEIAEKSVPSPWLMDAPSQLVTLYPDRNRTVYFENHKRPVIEIIKENAVTFERLANVPFQVWYASNNTSTGELNDLGIFYTDENGRIELDGTKMGTLGLRDGWFRVQELEPLKGFAKADPDTQEAFVPAGQGHTFRFRNQPLSAICVWKYDSVNPNVAIEGAVFQIRYLSGNTSGTGGTVIGTFRTSANGSFTATGLAKGTYIIEELSSDGSHVIDTPPQTVYLSGEEQEVIQVYFGNSPKGGLLVSKAGDKGEPLSGVEFLVTKSDGTLVGDANGKFTTGLDGTFLVDNIDPGTTLVVKETRQKEGYVLDDVAQTALIRAGQTVKLQFINHKKGNLVIHKLSSLDKTPLEGAQFKLTYADGKVVDADGGQQSSNGLYWTNSEGQIVVSNITGTVIATEVASPEGFAIDPNTRTQTVVINPGDDTQHLTFYNTPLCSLTLTKLDSLTQKPVSNVTFSVKDGNGNLIGRYTTGKDGTVTVTGLLPGSTVVVSEYKVPDNYVLDTTPQTIILKSGANSVTSGVVGGSNGGNSTTGNGNDLVFENDPKMVLTIHKYVKGTDFEPLKGVCFKIVDGYGKPIGTNNGVYYTNSAGEIVLEDLEPGTTVTAREISTVEGYVLDGEPQTITIQASKKPQELIFWNEKAGSLVIQKKSSLDGSPLAGVQFLLTYADGSYVDYDNGHMSSKGLYETDAAGEIRITGIVGTVIAKEIKTLPNFTIDPATQTQTVTIRPNDCQTLVFYNTPVGGVEIIKAVEGSEEKRIPNVTFEIRRMDGALVNTVTTGTDGRVFVSLEAGSYYAVETKCPSQYKLDSTPHYFEVVSGKATPPLLVTNKAVSGITLHKTDSVSGKGIYGVTFLLYDSKHNLITQETTDNQGYAYFEDLTEGGRYYLKELENEGYIPDTELKTVVVKSGESTLVEWKNTPITAQIQITKKSADYNSTNGLPAGTLLEGAVFEIRDKAGNLVDTIRSDSRGVATSKPLPLSRYTIREVKAPANYGVSDQELTAYLEHAGQIVRFEVTNKSLSTGVSITKTGPKQIMAGQPVRYVFSDIGNNSNVMLTSFYWRDTLPAEVRLDSVVTGTYNFEGRYKITYRVNGGEPRTLADNLSTGKNYTLAASATALGLASNERVTEIMFVFGQAPAGFAQVEKPMLYCTAVKSIAATSFVNVADVGGVYNGIWVQAVSRWVTTVYGKPIVPTLPKTGY